MPLPTIYTFADESGDLTFNNSGSDYFVVCAVSMRSLAIAHRLLDLRHDLTMSGQDIEKFHAVNDGWPVRQRVFAEIQATPVEIDAVVMHKRKTYPHIAANEGYFYQLAWHLLSKYLAPRRCQANDHLLVVAASLGTAARKTRFRNAVDRVVRQHHICQSVAVGFWQAATHPCLQAADYCGWAIQRWKENGDQRSYNLIQGQVRSVFEPFAINPNNYY
jgi:hypothetical protein